MNYHPIPKLKLSRKEHGELKKLMSFEQIWNMESAWEIISEIQKDRVKKRIDKVTNEYGIRFEDEFIYDEYIKLFELLGFKKINSTTSFRVSDRDYVGEAPDRHDIYAHKSGVLVVMDSYSQNAFGERKFNNALITSNLDLGMGFSAWLGVSRINGSSSSCDFQITGGHVRHTCFKETRSIYGICNHLEEIQRAGKLKPFKDWDDAQFLRIGPEYIIDINENTYPDIKNNYKSELPKIAQDIIDKSSDFYNKDYGIDGLNKVLKLSLFSDWCCHFRSKFDKDLSLGDYIKKIVNDKYPEELEYLTSHYYEKTKLKKPDFVVEGFRWREVERALIEIERVADFSQVRYFDNENKELCKKWIGFLAKEQSNITIEDLKNIEYEKRLSGDISFGQLFLQEATSNKNSCDLLIQVIDIIPKEVLIDWCSKPDKSGKTLGMLIVDAMIRPCHHYSLDDQFFSSQNLIERIISKVGSENVIMDSEKWSVNGMWLHHFLNNDNFYGNKMKSYHEILGYIEKLKDLGLSISSDWVIYMPLDNRYYPEKGRLVSPSKHLVGKELSDIINDIGVTEPVKMEKLIKELTLINKPGSLGKKLKI